MSLVSFEMRADFNHNDAVKLVKFKTFSDTFEVDLIKGILENEGIPFELQNYHFSKVYPNALGHLSEVSLWVREEDWDRVQDLLTEVDQSQETVE